LTTEIADILLVDDDKFAAELMTSYLSKQAKIKWAKSEESAYELIENENFTIAFLDINLGAGGNGVNIARYIRETKLNTQINIIAVTGYSDQKERDQIMQTGYFNSYLTKPFKKSTILNLVNSILP
jgi:CheY-like chemotaxis protein